MPPGEWIDDITISNEELLWRRIHRNHISCGQDGNLILSSAAFKSRHNLLSVDIASLTRKDKSLDGYPEHSLAEFTAGLARSAECIIRKEPLNNNPAHANVIGKNRPDGCLTSSQASEIAKQAKIIEFRILR